MAFPAQLPAQVASPATADASRSPAARLLAAARLEPQVAQFARNFGRGWSGGLNNPALPPAIRARNDRLLNEIMAEHLTAARLTSEVEAALGKMAPADAAAALEWWSSPLGARIATIDATPESPELQVAMARFVGDLQVKPLPPERVQRMTDLVATVGVGSFMRDLTRRTLEGLLAAVRASVPAGAAAPQVEQLESQLAGALDVLAVRAEQAVRLQLLYQYRDIGDAELDRYVEFARSPAGRAYTTALYGALTEGVTRAAQAFGARLVAKDEDASRT
ncbi:MAG: hypothetical protein MUF07_00075 [Steroidobacteraceae bacterium]|nr:hypothetical protein [Steroidobacteraceae bacterium]